MTNYNDTFSVLTGGGADSLDGFFVPLNGNFAFGMVNGVFHGYTFDSSNSDSENVPYIIKADDATPGSWVLGGLQGALSHVRAVVTTTQSMVGGSATLIKFNSETHDVLNEHNVSTGVFTAKYSGYYSIAVNTTNDNVSVSAAVLLLYKNGSEYSRGSRAVGVYASGVLVDTMYLAATDYIDIRMLISGSSVDLLIGDPWCHLSIDRIG